MTIFQSYSNMLLLYYGSGIKVCLSVIQETYRNMPDQLMPRQDQGKTISQSQTVGWAGSNDTGDMTHFGASLVTIRHFGGNHKVVCGVLN